MQIRPPPFSRTIIHAETYNVDNDNDVSRLYDDGYDDDDTNNNDNSDIYVTLPAPASPP